MYASRANRRSGRKELHYAEVLIVIGPSLSALELFQLGRVTSARLQPRGRDCRHVFSDVLHANVIEAHCSKQPLIDSGSM